MLILHYFKHSVLITLNLFVFKITIEIFSANGTQNATNSSTQTNESAKARKLNASLLLNGSGRHWFMS